jgi:hypothetical protein
MLLSGFPWPIKGNTDNNFESRCIIGIPKSDNLLMKRRIIVVFRTSENSECLRPLGYRDQL